MMHKAEGARPRLRQIGSEPDASACRLIDTLFFDVLQEPAVAYRLTRNALTFVHDPGYLNVEKGGQ